LENIGKYWKILENIGKYWKILENNEKIDVCLFFIIITNNL